VVFLRVGGKWLEGMGVYVPDPAGNSIFRYYCVLSLSTKKSVSGVGAELGSRWVGVKDGKTSWKVRVHEKGKR
jgi:hypothetical protein